MQCPLCSKEVEELKAHIDLEHPDYFQKAAREVENKIETKISRRNDYLDQRIRKVQKINDLMIGMIEMQSYANILGKKGSDLPSAASSQAPEGLGVAQIKDTLELVDSLKERFGAEPEKDDPMDQALSTILQAALLKNQQIPPPPDSHQSKEKIIDQMLEELPPPPPPDQEE